MDNLTIYESFRKVPDEAKKEIKGGRLSGKTDINPMWRIKALTERFGPCGIGWKIEIVKSWNEACESTGEVAAFVQINLYFKHDGEWSEAIPGTGGSSFAAKEKLGPYMSDECYKMALTDAISVSCKMLGVGADVYWEKDSSKYDRPTVNNSKKENPIICPTCNKKVEGITTKSGEYLNPTQIMERWGQCTECIKKRNQNAS